MPSLMSSPSRPASSGPIIPQATGTPSWSNAARSLRGGARVQSPYDAMLSASTSDMDPQASEASSLRTAMTGAVADPQQDAKATALSMMLGGGSQPPATDPKSRARAILAGSLQLSDLGGRLAASSLMKPSQAFSATGQALDAGSRAPSGALNMRDQMPSPFDSPEVQANKLAYLRHVMQGGIDSTFGGGQTARPGIMTRNGVTTLVQPGSGTSDPMTPDRAMMGTKTFDFQRTPQDPNQVTPDKLASTVRDIMAEGNQPRFVEDPVTGMRRVIFGNEMQPSGVNPDKAAAQEAAKKKTGVEQVQIGPQTYFYHHDSKKYFDAKGKPVVFPSASAGGVDAALSEASEPAATAEPAAAAPAAAGPTADAIGHLKGNPDLAPAFDAKYGPGAAAKALGKPKGKT